MVAFVLKGHVNRSSALSTHIIRIVRKYNCEINANINGIELAVNDRIIQWINIFDTMIMLPCSTAVIRVTGEKEHELAGELVSFIWNYDPEEDHLILTMLNSNMFEVVDNLSDTIEDPLRLPLMSAYQHTMEFYCPVCGLPIDRDFIHCPACGYRRGDIWRG